MLVGKFSAPGTPARDITWHDGQLFAGGDAVSADRVLSWERAGYLAWTTQNTHAWFVAQFHVPPPAAHTNVGEPVSPAQNPDAREGGTELDAEASCATQPFAPKPAFFRRPEVRALAAVGASLLLIALGGIGVAAIRASAGQTAYPRPNPAAVTTVLETYYPGWQVIDSRADVDTPDGHGDSYLMRSTTIPSVETVVYWLYGAGFQPGGEPRANRAVDPELASVLGSFGTTHAGEWVVVLAQQGDGRSMNGITYTITYLSDTDFRKTNWVLGATTQGAQSGLLTR